ncbi:MAG: pyridoxamine 5'-phosphate oxidase [Gemmatimonadaceae bacterium]|nr:pyridoxamine 5'-phosphate oxidase [Gemmatimonadaceae bacterium]
MTDRPVNLADLRAEYSTVGITREELNDDPVAQFSAWFDQACASGIHEPNAMSLATAGSDGRPVARTVLLKQYDERGFVFFTNLESRKARHLAENPHAALLFPWVALERQILITGRVERVSMAEAAAYFVTRPVGSQLAAWASPQSTVLSSRGLLEAKWEEMKRKFADGKIPLPSFWGGYRVLPELFEFWQGRASRMHDRFQYTPKDGAWVIERLAP